MALRHAVLAALLDGEYSGYQLAKIFDIAVSNFWHAVPQQLYTELARLEKQGLIKGRQVIQHDRPNKRVYTVTPEGIKELQHFATLPAKPAVIREDLLVILQAVDHIPVEDVITQLEERAMAAAAKVDLFDRTLERLRGDLDEETFLREGSPIGPYLTCLRGRRFEYENYDCYLQTAKLLRERATAHAEDPESP
ncbi:PadR family transcriptional regulator [Actinomadura sp. NBRC 104412]|uniref:PadR family transcriptional regulator n=1 Tax=Actinomadura sp. NBRC 104412 TaxID=3032203 RepID=UPI0024A278B9|nr:PadR family transcriptional regulator [Actinomadura sp. NBRC 104412]GLZ02907.1 PadR family transcriptional regulator [Actinomadura sp. NBRC 104412]